MLQQFRSINNEKVINGRLQENSIETKVSSFFIRKKNIFKFKVSFITKRRDDEIEKEILKERNFERKKEGNFERKKERKKHYLDIY